MQPFAKNRRARGPLIPQTAAESLAPKRAVQVFGRIAGFAVASGKTVRDISGNLRSATKNRTAVPKHFAALTSTSEAGQLILTTDQFHSSATVFATPRFATLTFVRPGELRRTDCYSDSRK